jgi:hypothetical protein
MQIQSKTSGNSLAARAILAKTSNNFALELHYEVWQRAGASFRLPKTAVFAHAHAALGPIARCFGLHGSNGLVWAPIDESSFYLFVGGGRGTIEGQEIREVQGIKQETATVYTEVYAQSPKRRIKRIFNLV